MEEFVGQYNHLSPAERLWLSELYTGVCEQVYPLVGVSVGVSVEQLCHAVVCRVRRLHGALPLTYRLIPVAELIATQHTPCFSSLTWSTNQYRAWIRGAELQPQSERALPRRTLVLIGVVGDGGRSEGCWRLSDASGSVLCEAVTSAPQWCGKLMLLPTWNYIPHDAAGSEQEVGGCVELMETPICVTPEPMACDPGRSMSDDVITISNAVSVLKQRSRRGACISVRGLVAVLCPLMVISGKPFFSFVLSEGDVTLSVLVTVPQCLYWRQCLRVGQSVCVSALHVCSVRGWAGHRVLSVSPESRLHPNHPMKNDLENTLSDTHTHTQSLSKEADSHTLLQPGPDLQTAQVHDGPAGGANMVRTKVSKIISYKGRITEVMNAEAGLYVMDGKVMLCLAFQPPRKWSGALRPGAELELHHIHFLFRVSPFFPEVALCACLRTSVCITSFSPLSWSVQTADPRLVHCLMDQNLTVSEYLWLCYSSAALTDRLCPRWVCAARVCVVAVRLLRFILSNKTTTKEKRDIYKEILQQPHTCPLTQYCVWSPSVPLYSVQELCDWLEKAGWGCVSSLLALLPSSARHMTKAELNPLLAWSVHTPTLSHTPTLTHTSTPEQRALQAVLVGVLELSSTHGTVRLVDRTGAIDCVCVQRQNPGDQCTPINTAWIGCLVCIKRCVLVMERFMKTDFPSYKHLDQVRYIQHKHCRMYICVSVEDLHILSSSTAMTNLTLGSGSRCEGEVMRRRRRDSEAMKVGGMQADGTIKPSEGSREEEPMKESRSKRRRRVEEEEEHPAPPPSCVSLLFYLLSKQGVAFRNLHSSSETLTLSFITKATQLSDPQVWDGDPKNRSVQEREMERAKFTSEIELHFVSAAVRWFPMMQPGTVYRVIALHTQDVGVFSCSSVPVRAGVSLLSSSVLLIQPQWRIHTVHHPLLLSQLKIQKVMSVSEILHTCSDDVVSVHGVVSERITLQEERSKPPSIQSLISIKDGVMEADVRVRLTLQDSDSSHLSLQVYLDLTQNPFTAGLIAGATVHLHHLQRKVSVVRNVYCCSLPISCVTVTGFGCLKPHPSPPVVHLGEWVTTTAVHGIVGEVRGHVVCVLSLRLQWACSLCGSVFRQTTCSRSCPPCASTSAVFQAEAKVAVDDGTGEAQIWFSSESVAGLLQVTDCEWEGLQRLVRIMGYVRVYTRGRSMVCDVDPDDPLVQFLSCLCSSTTVCRHVTLTCKQRLQKPEKVQLRKVSRREREFLTKFPKPLQLHCIHIHTL